MAKIKKAWIIIIIIGMVFPWASFVYSSEVSNLRVPIDEEYERVGLAQVNIYNSISDGSDLSSDSIKTLIMKILGSIQNHHTIEAVFITHNENIPTAIECEVPEKAKGVLHIKFRTIDDAHSVLKDDVILRALIIRAVNGTIVLPAALPRRREAEGALHNSL